jgi:hypothetical protein
VGRLRSPALLGLIVVACVAVPAAAVATPLHTASPTVAAANSATFNDSTGEDPTAPDITSIVVSNDDTGMLSFRINVPNRPELGQDMEVDLWVDTDQNVATGDPQVAGVDYVIQLVQGEVNLFRWDGTGFTRRFGDPSAVTLSFAYQGGVTVRISTNELGNTKQLRFFVIVASGIVYDPTTGAVDDTNAKADVAPGGGAGLYPFEVKVGRATLQVKKFTPTPAKPVAGRTFALRLQAARSDTGAAIRSGRVICVGRVGKSSLRAQSGRFVGREAVCTWRIPAGAEGKPFRGSITIVFEGLKAARSYSRAIG